jgi:hypothetical protein
MKKHHQYIPRANISQQQNEKQTTPSATKELSKTLPLETQNKKT